LVSFLTGASMIPFLHSDRAKMTKSILACFVKPEIRRNYTLNRRYWRQEPVYIHQTGHWLFCSQNFERIANREESK